MSSVCPEVRQEQWFSVVLNWGDSAPQDTWHCLWTFLVVTAGEEVATGISRGEARNPAQQPAVYNPPQQRIIGP